MLNEPLEPVEALRLARELLDDGKIRYTNHAREEMAKDRLAEVDIERALRGGVEPGE